MRKLDYETRTSTIQTVGDFLKDLGETRDKWKHAGTTWYFRGDRKDDPLKPSIGQVLKYGGKKFVADEAVEKKFLNRFKRYAYPHLNQIQGDWEALFLARHYDLPTRILDWSANPLVALYFACSPQDKATPDGYLWGILRFPDETHDVDILDPKKKPFSLFDPGTRAVKLIYPVYNSGRITAQKGIFSWHSHPHEPLDKWAGTSFCDSELDIAVLIKWAILASNRTKLVEDLA